MWRVDVNVKHVLFSFICLRLNLKFEGFLFVEACSRLLCIRFLLLFFQQKIPALLVLVISLWSCARRRICYGSYSAPQHVVIFSLYSWATPAKDLSGIYYVGRLVNFWNVSSWKRYFLRWDYRVWDILDVVLFGGIFPLLMIHRFACRLSSFIESSTSCQHP